MGENLHKKSDLEVENENVVVDSVLMHKATPEYLQELLKDKRQLQNFPNIFLHLEFILEKGKYFVNIFHMFSLKLSDCILF